MSQYLHQTVIIFASVTSTSIPNFTLAIYLGQIAETAWPLPFQLDTDAGRTWVQINSRQQCYATASSIVIGCGCQRLANGGQCLVRSFYITEKNTRNVMRIGKSLEPKIQRPVRRHAGRQRLRSGRLGVLSDECELVSVWQ